MMPAITEAILTVSSSMGLSILAKATLIVAVGVGAARLARWSRASVRHTLLAATFGVLLLLPALSAIVPPLRIALRLEAQPGPVAALAGRSASAAAIRSVPTAAPPQTPRASLADLLIAAWIAGAALFLIPVVLGLRQVLSLRRTGLPWPEGQSRAGALARDAELSQSVDALLHEALAGPMTCGVARPAILFPCDAPGWDAADLDRAIVHELEHVRRRDWAIHCLARAVCAVYWFHPLVWMAWRRLELEAERACDDAVLARSEPTAYADQLVSVARRLSAASKPPLLAMASRADLSARVTSVLDNRRRRGRAGRLCVAAASTAAAALVLALSPLRVIAAPQPARGGVQLRVETALVMVDAAVSYPNGATIEGLSAGDFTLTEDGVPQRISVFEFQKTDGPAPVSGHYVLGYYSASPNADGQFRKIEISVKNASTAKIEARAGYVAKKWADTPRIALAEPVEPGVRPPVLLYKKEPEYPEEARKAKFQGHVMLSVSVDTSGRTDKIRVQRAVGLGLDEKAVEAVRQWRFRPAMKDGKPIAVSITVDVSFRLM